MATNITITKQTSPDATHGASSAPARKVPGWLWFIALWCFGVGSAMSLGFAFKLLMNATLFAVK
ncbi:hypothetical protein VSR69_29935 [Paraburkholderia phytofirmans]|jgi:hypothetical protein|uniref:hypothetical protein n=1 Tax=Paraburkholderia sp. BL9I2N2 TaxID=1938809 RepID=UPI00104565BC|nr:hypothetical protein [Paraburkholderia sp. BL9I2N2]TCK87642.1 hypothetical protein B0G74_8195 [Paraburkholderia sp. BL9I2N2]